MTPERKQELLLICDEVNAVFEVSDQRTLPDGIQSGLTYGELRDLLDAYGKQCRCKRCNDGMRRGGYCVNCGGKVKVTR